MYEYIYIYICMRVSVYVAVFKGHADKDERDSSCVHEHGFLDT